MGLMGKMFGFVATLLKRNSPPPHLGVATGAPSYSAKASLKNRSNHPLRRSHFGTFSAMSMRHRGKPPYKGH